MVFTLGPSAHLRPLATIAGLGTISRSFRLGRIARFIQDVVVKTFRQLSITVFSRILSGEKLLSKLQYSSCDKLVPKVSELMIGGFCVRAVILRVFV